MFPQPSFLAHILHAFLLLIAIIYAIQNARNLIALDPYRVSVLLLLFSIVIGIHALSHLGLETRYGYVWGRREAFVNGFTCPCRTLGRGSGCPYWKGQCPYYKQRWMFTN